MTARLIDPRRKDGTFPFVYVPAAATDVRKTFERVRAEQQVRAPLEVRPLPRRIRIAP
jgi:hypothetical protein